MAGHIVDTAVSLVDRVWPETALMHPPGKEHSRGYAAHGARTLSNGTTRSIEGTRGAVQHVQKTCGTSPRAILGAPISPFMFGHDFHEGTLSVSGC